MLASLCPLDLVFLYFLNEKKIQTSYPSNVKEFERCNASWIDHLRVFKYSELAQRMPLLAGIVASTQRISRRAGLGPLTNQQRL